MFNFKQSSLWGDLAAAGSIIGAFVGWLPYLAAGMGVIYYCVLFWESPLRERWSGRRRLAKLERLEREHAARAGEIEKLKGELKGK